MTMAQCSMRSEKKDSVTEPFVSHNIKETYQIGRKSEHVYKIFVVVHIATSTYTQYL